MLTENTEKNGAWILIALAYEDLFDPYLRKDRNSVS